MSDTSMLDVQTAVHHTRDALVVESMVDAARTTHGQTSITVRLALTLRGVVVTLTTTRGPLAAPTLREKVIFVLAPGDLDNLAATIRAAVDVAHRQIAAPELR